MHTPYEAGRSQREKGIKRADRSFQMIEKIKALCVKYEEIIAYLIVGVLNTLVSWGAWFLCAYTFLDAQIVLHPPLFVTALHFTGFFPVCQFLLAVFRRAGLHMGAGCGHDDSDGKCHAYQ